MYIPLDAGASPLFPFQQQPHLLYTPEYKYMCIKPDEKTRDRMSMLYFYACGSLREHEMLRIALFT